MSKKIGRDRTYGIYHLDLLQQIKLTEDGMPVIHPCEAMPTRLIGFNNAKTSRRIDCGVHFFIDDYQFQRVWNRPEDYTDLLARFQCMLTPDFSLYTDMPAPMLRWNCYRNRLLGAWWQAQGLQVIPTLQWSRPSSYEYCFDGLPHHSTVAVSTVGVLNDRKATRLWVRGFREALEMLEPSKVLFYGKPIPGYAPPVKCVYYNNETITKLKQIDERKES
ncbi:DUF4417 domain-containing protein [Bifidobacterium sp. ESL0784]|uniref:DUF4417 domain-containing protein n=1 Tax=Bifidobacterium sp. ESL0784 TaxID=2983231 RepID=UPI0023F8EE79|nr:DUF4417 domain-containing protein [Bifidobacterium sp. ESL0784]MDF7641712.1 DUF4417 domain-containing protein [Bifidobacterium sp. ESL0784]